MERSASVLALMVGFAAPGYSWAAEVVSTANTDAAPPAAQAGAGSAPAASLQEIVVTGSRVQSNGFSAPTPLTVLGIQDLQRKAPMNIADAVNELPQFSNSPTAHNSGDSVSDGNAGVSNLDLRGLGASRTLVLLDGVRVVPSSITGFYLNGGAVDTNPFPDELIKRVDVVTGGASAVYGSDAIAGAVNFVLDKTFTGVKGEVSGGLSNYGDDGAYRVSAAGGAGFANDRGHVLLSGSYVHNDGILTNDKRGWLTGNNIYEMTNPAYTATNGQPFNLIVNHAGSSIYAPGGLISSGPLRGAQFGPGGSTRAFNYGAINNGTVMSGGDWAQTEGAINESVSPDVSLDPRITRKNVFGRASYDLTDNIQVYGQFMYAQTDTFAYSGDFTSSGINIRSGNPFIPASVQSAMTDQGLSSFTMGENMSSSLGLVPTETSRKFTQYLGGATGKFEAFKSDWTWNAYYTLSTSALSANVGNDLIKSRFAQATNVVTNPANGSPICASTLTNPGDGCAPFNPMGIGVASPAAINYITANSHLAQFLAQNEELVTVSGEPLSTWAGPVSVSFGYENRKVSVTGASTPLDLAKSFFIGNYTDTHGNISSNEGFFETLIPLAKDLPWAKQWSLNGAVRETDYNTSGAVTTWKVGSTYAPTSEWLFRATRSHDIRAPNLGELFSSGQAGTSNIRDDFKGNAIVPYVNIAIGNSALKPEAADTTSAGIVYQPKWLPGLTASVDYYDIGISGAIITTDSQAIVDSCYAGQQVFCSFITRDAGGNIQYIYQKPANTEFLRENGLDIEASYRKSLADIGLPGSVSVRALASRVFHLTYQENNGQVVEGAGNDGSGDYATPSWRYNVTAAYDWKDVSLAWTGRGFSDGVYDNSYIVCSIACPTSQNLHQTINDNHMAGAFYMDLSLVYRFKVANAPQEFFLTVENVADAVPDNVGLIGFGPGQYNLLGRTYRTGVRFRF